MKFIKLEEKSYPLILLILVLAYFTFFTIQGRWFDFWADLDIYLNISQILFHGGTLYQNANDTKHIGFFFFFYLIYAPYALMFNTLEFFHIWHSIILSILYYGILMLVYRIVSSLYDKKSGFITSVSVLLFIFGHRHATMINQPQVAVFFALLFLWYLRKTYERQSYKDYLIYGVLLGITFAINHIYAPIVLIVPFLSIQKFLLTSQKEKRNILSSLYECSIAGLGFFTVISFFLFYLYTNNAFQDWMYWNWYYPINIYLREIDIYSFNNQKFLIKNTAPKLLVTCLGLLGIGHTIPLPYSYPMLIHYFILNTTIVCFWTVIYKNIRKKGRNILRPIEYTFMLFGWLTIASRLLISRVGGSDSYNIYIIPFIMFCIPVLYKESERFKKIWNKFLMIGLVLSILYIPFRYFVAPNKVKYSACQKKIVALNPEKKPTVMCSYQEIRITEPVYSTKWKAKFYTLDNSSIYDYWENVHKIMPEVLLTDSIPDNQKYILNYYEYICGILFIRKDMLSTWNLNL